MSKLRLLTTQVLNAIDEESRRLDPRDYGLPLSGEQREKLEQIVFDALLSVSDQRDKLEAHTTALREREAARKEQRERTYAQTKEMADLYRRQGNYERAAALFTMLEEWEADHD